MPYMRRSSASRPCQARGSRCLPGVQSTRRSPRFVDDGVSVQLYSSVPELTVDVTTRAKPHALRAWIFELRSHSPLHRDLKAEPETRYAPASKSIVRIE